MNNSIGRSLLEEHPTVQPTKNLSAIYGIRRFVVAITKALSWSLFCARSIQSTPPHSISQTSILNYPPIYILVFIVVSSPLAFPPITYMRSSSPISCYMPCPFYVHCHHGMAYADVVGRGDGLQLWRVIVNSVIKQPRPAYRWWSSNYGGW
jgi:hypothetical protein